MFNFFKKEISEDSNFNKLPSDILPIIARETLPSHVDLYNTYLGSSTHWSDWKDWRDLVSLSHVNKQFNSVVRNVALMLAQERSQKLKEDIKESKIGVFTKLKSVSKLMWEKSNVHSVTIDGLCFQTYICKHRMSVTYKNGIKKKFTESGDVIQEIYKSHASLWQRRSWVDKHFAKYDKSNHIVDPHNIDNPSTSEQFLTLIFDKYRKHITATLCATILVLIFCALLERLHNNQQDYYDRHIPGM